MRCKGETIQLHGGLPRFGRFRTLTRNASAFRALTGLPASCIRSSSGYTASRMYSVDERDEVVALDNVPAPDAGAPAPRLAADEHEARVTYFVRGLDDDAVTITFSGLYVLTFGPPNDEAFDAHPLAGRGLGLYGAFEVLASSWVRSLERQNRVHPAHRPETFDRLRHFVLTFHDTTFECVATSASATPAV